MPCCCSPLQQCSLQTVCWTVSGLESQGQGLMIDITPLPSSIPIYVLNSPSSWTRDRGYGEGGNKIKNNTQSDMNTGCQQLNGGNTTPFSSSFTSPKHTDGRWTGRQGEDRQADAQTAGRLNTSLTITVTLQRGGIERLEMQQYFLNALCFQ